MPINLRGASWRFATYAVACLLAIFAVLAVFAQWRFQPQRTYKAVFANVSGLKGGNFVRVAGVEVGKVKRISIQPDYTLLVEFGVDDSVVITEGTRAAIRYEDVIGGRYLTLEEGAGGMHRLAPRQTIPASRTSPALDLEALIGGFRPLFQALNPDQINSLTGELIGAFQGQGTTINSILSQTASLTSTLANRDQLIGDVIVNLNAVLGSFGGQSDQFGKAVDSLSQLVAGLEARKEDIRNGVAYVDAAARSIADLLTQARKPAQQVVHETDRTAGLVLADHDYVDNLLNTLPDTYQLLDRLAVNGDFFGFYLCDLLLKVNGKGGQPMYIKMAGQASGRCTPR